MIDEKIVSEYEAMVENLRYLAHYAKENNKHDLSKVEDRLLGYITDCFALKLKKSLESE